MFEIVKDVFKGARFASDIPGYLFYLLRKSFWLWLVIIGIGLLVVTAAALR